MSDFGVHFIMVNTQPILMIPHQLLSFSPSVTFQERENLRILNFGSKIQDPAMQSPINSPHTQHTPSPRHHPVVHRISALISIARLINQGRRPLSWEREPSRF